MLYDLSDGPPPTGTLLELVMILIAKRRQEAQFFQVRTMIDAILASNVEGGAEALKESFRAYREVLLPFVGNEDKKQKEKARKILNKWTNMLLKVRPLWKAKENKQLASRLRRNAEKIRQIEESRRKARHTRM